MASYKKSVEDLEAVRSRNNNAIKNQLEHLGKQVALVDEKQIADAPFAGAVSTIHAKEQELEQKERTIAEWNELSETLESIAADGRLVDVEIAATRAELEPHYESVGEAVLDLYHSTDEELGELSVLADQIVALQEDIRSKERELQSIESGDKQEGFIGKTLAVGRGIVIRGSLRSRGNRRSRALRDIGERVCMMGIADLDESSPLTKALFPVRESLAELSKLKERRQTLDESTSAAEEKRLEIEKRERMRNPVRNLGHATDLLRTQINELAVEIGTAFVEHEYPMKETSSEIDTARAAITRLEEENGRAETLIERLNAAIAVDRITEQLDGKKAARVQLEAEISAIDATVEELKSEKTVTSKARGTLASLDSALRELLGE